jgi:hypothetical protein
MQGHWLVFSLFHKLILLGVYFLPAASIMDQKHLPEPGPGREFKIWFLADRFSAYQARVPRHGIEIISPFWVRVFILICPA